MRIKTLLAVLGLVAIWSVDILADKEAMTLEQTITANYVGTSKISPNGEFTAYTLVKPRTPYKDDDGAHRVELHLVDEQGNSRPFITGDVRISNVTWAPTGDAIYYTSKRNDDKYTSIYLIPVDGGESLKVVEHENNISSFTISSDGSTLVFISKDMADKNEKKLKKKGFKAEVYEEDKEANFAYSYNLMDDGAKPTKIAIDGNVISTQFHPTTKELLVRTTPTPHIDDLYVASSYSIVDMDGDVEQTFKTEGKLDDAAWSPTGDYVAIIGAENKNDPAAGRLFLADADSGKLSELLPNYQGHVEGIEWISDYQLAYLGAIGTSTELTVINVDSKSSTNLIPLNIATLRGLSKSESGELVSTIGRAEHPREVYSVTGGELKRLTNSNPWLSEIKMPKQEAITYKARDGVELDGVLVYPIDYSKRKRYPLIMMVHGGPEAHISNEWLDRYSYPIKHAAANGFAVFLPNYRGSTGKGVEHSKMGQADYAGAEFNDLVDAIDHLTKMGLVDKKRVGITGGSYGGYASAWGATALSEHFAASVMFVGISNQLSKYGTTDIPKEMYNVHARNYPWDKWMWMLERSPIYHTDKAKTPILIMHGKEDTRVHPAQSMELYRYIKTRTDTPVRLVYYPGEGHGNRRAAAQLDYGKRLMRWMSYYLTGKDKGNTIPPYELDHAEQMGSDKPE